MGSSLNKSHRSYDLYNDIKISINELLDEYKFWTNKKICNDLELVYYDKLIRFKKDDLVNASTAIGYKFHNNTNKSQICNKIVTHYTNRVNLLNYILNVVEVNQKKVIRANNGPVCTKINGFVDDLYYCNQIKGAEWINKNAYKEHIKKLKDHKKYDLWKERLNNLDFFYEQNIKELQDIISKIKGDINNSMSDSEYNALVHHTKNILKKFNTLSNVYYLIVINTN